MGLLLREGVREGRRGGRGGEGRVRRERPTQPNFLSPVIYEDAFKQQQVIVGAYLGGWPGRLCPQKVSCSPVVL